MEIINFQAASWSDLITPNIYLGEDALQREVSDDQGVVSVPTEFKPETAGLVLDQYYRRWTAPDIPVLSFGVSQLRLYDWQCAFFARC
jgi:hypothetical protein